MFWTIYYCILALIFVLYPIVCIIIYWCGRNKDYDGLDYYKVKRNKNKIIEEIDKFYRDKKKIKGYLVSGSLFYRKAWLSNKLKSKGIRKEVWGIVGSILLGSLITLFINPEGFGNMLSKLGIDISESALSIYIFFAIVMLIYKVYSSARNAMETARTGIWEYELSYIDSAIEEHLEKSSPYNIKKITEDSHKN